jgi:hypothetical protein
VLQLSPIVIVTLVVIVIATVISGVSASVNSAVNNIKILALLFVVPAGARSNPKLAVQLTPLPSEDHRRSPIHPKHGSHGSHGIRDLVSVGCRSGVSRTRVSSVCGESQGSHPINCIKTHYGRLAIDQFKSFSFLRFAQPTACTQK